MIDINILYDSEIERFHKHIIFPKDCKNECWETDLIPSHDGYTRLKLKRKGQTKIVGMHRLSYVIYNDTIPKDLIIRHLCNNPKCVNPLHLDVGTHQDNANDRTLANNNMVGSLNNFAKLTEEDVINILTDIYNNKYTNMIDIAIDYNVATATINDILNGTHWKSITSQLYIPLENLKQKVITINRQNYQRNILNDKKVLQIKRLLNQNLPVIKIAQLFGVHNCTIYDIKFKRTWKHVVLKDEDIV